MLQLDVEAIKERVLDDKAVQEDILQIVLDLLPAKQIGPRLQLHVDRVREAYFEELRAERFGAPREGRAL